jgi:hypothetical protein
MDTPGDATETACARAVADELAREPSERESLSLPALVLRCGAAGVSAPDVLRRALDRVTHQKDNQSAI